MRVYKLDGTEQWLAERGVEATFLPPYLPGFSPVELAWSKLNGAKTGQNRTSKVQERALQKAIDWIASQDVRNWFNHCGYHTKPVQLTD